MIKNKKAILVSETLKLILAVLSILILFYLGLKLFGIFNVKTTSEQAKAITNQIIGKIELLEDDGDFTEVLISNPINWRLIVYDNKLCLCSESAFSDKNKCETTGYCRIYDKTIIIEETCKSGFTEIKNCYPFLRENLPLELILQKTKENIKIRTEKEKTAEEILEKISGEDSIKQLIVGYYGDPDTNEEKLREAINNLEQIKSGGYYWELEIKVVGAERKETLSEATSFSEYSPESFAQKEIFESPSKKYEISLKLAVPIKEIMVI